MLGRSAAGRPFGMSPFRFAATAAANYRLSQSWITSQPLAFSHLHRFIAIAPHLLLTPATPTTASGKSVNNNGSSSSSPSSSSSSSAGSSSSSSTGNANGSSTSTQQTAGLHTSTSQANQPQQQSTSGLSNPTSSPPPLSSLSSPSQQPSTSIPTPPPSPSISAANTSSSATTTTNNSPIAFNYLLAASWHPKSRQQQSRTPTPKSSSSQLAGTAGTEDQSSSQWWKQKLRVGKVDAGEDAFFHVSTPSRVALGVADGVGGWSQMGVDPALFSWALMDNAEVVARLTDAAPAPNSSHASKSLDGASIPGTSSTPSAPTPPRVLDAQTILDGAYTELVQSGKVEAGSSTACILSLCKKTGTLRASNLGDSAYLLIRDNRCLYESPSQQHFFNCPYQLTVVPPGPGSSNFVTDLPKDAAQTTHQLQDGDVIVLATDGFWDNVFTGEAIELVNKELGDVIRREDKLLPVEDVVGRVRALSQRLTNTARRISLDHKRRTPFSKGSGRIGGKVDDITVIVTFVRAMQATDV